MLFSDLLGIADEPVQLIEMSFSDQKACNLARHQLTEIVRSGMPFGEVIRITGAGGPGGQDELLGIAVLANSEGQDFRMIFVNTICKDPGFTDLGAGLCEHTKNVRTVKTTDSQFMDAIIEYYSIMLVNRMLCDRCISAKKPFSEIFSESRVDRLTTLLKTVEQSGNTDFTGMDVLEICCGNGMATIALTELGCDPFCMDSDKCAICEGLEHGVLTPHRSVVLDATELSAFFDAESFDCIIGFMLGAIYPFNKDLWARIMSESVVLLRENGLLVFTVHKEEEIIILKEVMDAIGIEGEIIDNRDDAGVYDQWVYLGRKGSFAG
ncbi:MAG TPA: class I SAM-dependent methyltransferase [Methanosarcinales archaeon]|nr:class I SAM-dependent methyltransferase [Methanosarcinales archaeon]